MGFKKDILDHFKAIKNQLLNDAFYPELVTFEELNLKRPNDFFINLINELAKQNPEKRVTEDPEIRRVFGGVVDFDKLP